MENTRAWAEIDLAALRHNLQEVRRLAPRSRVLSVIKSDGYGHGSVRVAQALLGSDAFGVATFSEALILHKAGVKAPLLLLEGVMDADQLQQASALGFQIVVHAQWQLDLLFNTPIPEAVAVWLKIDTGMHRLGLAPADCLATWNRLQRSDKVQSVVLMSHLGCADESAHPLTDEQCARFTELVDRCAATNASLANSAAVLTAPDHHYQWVRPGLMLYGASPLPHRSASNVNLKPVMHLQARIFSLRTVCAGDSVGYGATWRALRDTRVAIVPIGYGDGYPRHINSQAQVLIQNVRCPVIGRVSMDMLAVDVSQLGALPLHTPVTLWGPGLPIEEVAQWAGTINYELMCQVTQRVARVYSEAEL